MKKYLSIVLVLFTVSVTAQTNTFPSSGNVGIGTTTPSYLLDINKTSNDAIIRAKTTTAGSYVYLDSYYDGYYGINLLSNGLTKWFLGGYGTTDFTISKQMGASELFRITSGGNVGVGTTSPAYKLDVNGVIQSTVNSGSNLFLTKSSGASVAFQDGTFQNAMIEAGSSINSNRLEFWTNTAANSGIVERMRIDNAGNVGIGTTGPSHLLQLGTNFNGSIADAKIFINAAGATNGGKIAISPDGNSAVASLIGQYFEGLSNSERLDLGTIGYSGVYPTMSIENGNVGIGTTSPSEKLSVNGNIRSKKLIVTQTGWADYVFNKSYKLKSLSEIEQFIKTNKHLPEVPSAKEIEKDGIDVGDTQALLLKKIEELTLYMIEQNKKVDEMKKENTKIKMQLQNENIVLKQLIEKLENKK